MKVGQKLKLWTDWPDGSVITYLATVRKIEPNIVWVEIPEKVRRLKFAPFGGKRYAGFAPADAAKYLTI